MSETDKRDEYERAKEDFLAAQRRLCAAKAALHLPKRKPTRTRARWSAELAAHLEGLKNQSMQIARQYADAIIKGGTGKDIP
jgi:hypothetical protein